jgi:hypothetical protein
MTAGRVVHIKDSGVAGRDGRVRKIQVMPGRNGSTLPYGSVTPDELPFRARLDDQRSRGPDRPPRSRRWLITALFATGIAR